MFKGRRILPCLHEHGILVLTPHEVIFWPLVNCLAPQSFSTSFPNVQHLQDYSYEAQDCALRLWTYSSEELLLCLESPA